MTKLKPGFYDSNGEFVTAGLSTDLEPGTEL